MDCPYGSGAELLHGGFQQLCDQQQTAGGPFEALKPSQKSRLVTAQTLSPFSGWKRRKVNQSQPRVQGITISTLQEDASLRTSVSVSQGKPLHC
ncbi:unnamed protein product [Toxocara canis]|uniref:cDNA n=1 Tax=Toxocara canis TaxID=6265 RepID=A0A183U8Z0_TOXCA|nr:unnamed protein product [Toxocara canis]